MKYSNERRRKMDKRVIVMWGVYTQYYPTWKYDETLESIWSSKELADEAVKGMNGYDYVGVREVYINSECLNFDTTKPLELENEG
jgi:hypothetical protein